MASFSERYGYVKPSNMIIREHIPIDIQNAICSCYDRLSGNFQKYCLYDFYYSLECYLWTHFLNNREAAFSDGKTYPIVATGIIENKEIKWYKKLDVIDNTLDYLYSRPQISPMVIPIANSFVKDLNSEFERLHFAYRIVGRKIVEVSSEEEIKTIETAMENCRDNIKMHLSKALELYAKRPEPDAQNSIKESISAVEAYCREITGAKSLGTALNNLSKKGVVIPKVLKSAFEMLYGYTNDAKSGIRHALMDADGKYAPSAEEAYFMLVTCSAFVNYLRGKGGK